MTKSTLGIPETAVDRFLREERERDRLYRDLLGKDPAAEAIRQATEHRKLLWGLDFDAPLRSFADVLERDRMERDQFKKLTSTAWAVSVTETARSIAGRHSELVDLQRQLSGSILETARALKANASVVDGAIAAASASDAYRQLIRDSLPGMSMFGAIAERVLTVDSSTLRASEGAARNATATAAEMVIEARRLAEAIAEAPSVEEGARLHRSLLDLLLRFLANLGPNTIPELQTMGLVGFITFIVTLVSAYMLIPRQAAQSPQEKAAFEQLSETVGRLQEEVRRYREAEGRFEEGYLAKLARAELTRDSAFRLKPARDGDVVLKAPRGMEVAIAEARGRWRLVVFRDPLSGQLSRAWVYETALTRLAPAPPAGE